MRESLGNYLSPNETTTLSVSTSVKDIITGARKALNVAPVIAAAVIGMSSQAGCGGEAFSQEESYEDAGDLDSQDSQDATTDQETGSDATPDAQEDTAPDVQPSDSGCQGTEITLTDMAGYEVFHAGLNCNPFKLDTTTNSTLETEDRTLCFMPNDRLVIVTYHDDNNNLIGTSTEPFDPAVVKRGGINMASTTVNHDFMLTQCLQKVEHGGSCTVENVADTDHSEYAFVYPGEPNCPGSTNPDTTGNIFYLQ